MSTNAYGNVRNLSDSRVEALQALESVSDRLSEILRDVPGDGTHRNENGELVNEEGLPIVDIAEPIELHTPFPSAAAKTNVADDNYPQPVFELSPEALGISRRHRDKILELLEEEEAQETHRTRRQQRAELERKKEAARGEIQKRMVTQSAELEKRRKTKELEKKMAKALVRGLEDSEPPTTTINPQPLVEKGKKTVTFADDPIPFHNKQHGEATVWGDVVPGRLPAKHNRSQPPPMRMEVVERPSSSKRIHAEPIPLLEEPHTPSENIGNSDDESDMDYHSDSTFAFEAGDEDVVLSAQYHQQLAIEYHKRREAFVSNASAIQLEDIASDGATTHTPSGIWDKEDVPLEATLAHPPPNPQVSKFKTSLLNSHFKPKSASHGHPDPPLLNSASTFGAAALPPSVLSSNIKMGKLVDGKLVSEYEEEEREAREEEEIRKLLLKSMEDYSSIATQSMSRVESHIAKAKANSTPPPRTSHPPSAPEGKHKVSRFKVNRAKSREPSASAMDPSTLSNSSTTSLHGLLSHGALQHPSPL